MLYDPNIKKRILENARRADFKDLSAYLNDPNVPQDDKLNTLYTLKGNADWAKSAGSFGQYVEDESRLNFFARVPPLEVQLPKSLPQIPIIVSSNQARNQFNFNLEKLRRFENQYKNLTSTTPMIEQKPKTDLKGTV